MSGPKVSSYELNRQHQRELRNRFMIEQRRIEERRRQQDGFRNNIRSNVTLIRNLKNEIQKRVLELGNQENIQFDIEVFQKLCDDADLLIGRSQHIHDSREILPETAKKNAEEAKQIIERLRQQNQKALDEQMMLESASFMESMRSIHAVSEPLSSTENTKAMNDEYLNSTLNAYHSGCALLAAAQSEMPEKAAEIDGLQKQLDSQFKELGGSPREVYHAVLYCQREIEHKVNVLRKEAEQTRIEQNKRADLVHRYHYYCKELCLSCMSVEELNLQTAGELESLCATLDNMLYRQYEENYIFQCINEAMADIGYELYGRATNGIRGQFLYQMHGDTVVHVACSDQGIISMEIGRASNMQRKLDSTEIEELVQDMHVFCDNYAVLQEKLDSMGVKCKENIELNPPHADFAMLLDTTQYELYRTGKNEREETQKNVQYLDLGV